MLRLVTRTAMVPGCALLLAVAPADSTAADPPAIVPAAAVPALLPTPLEAAASALEQARAAEAEELAREAESLRPGEFVWRPSAAAGGPVEIVVSIPLQRAYVYRGGTLIGLSTVSTGRRGHETPTGRFDILEKRRQHFSNLYNNAPMPFMQRLTWDGIALHAGQIPGHPASHGCVRLPLDFARNLFAVTRVGASVHVVDASPSPVDALAMVRGGDSYRGMGGPEEEVPGVAD
jgi:lipoprotein-anchoring transpeptidase ErfK/SrfK